MPLKSHKPTTKSLRGTILLDSQEVTVQKPKKSLVLPLKKRAGRSRAGTITVRHRGGGHKRRLRIIDFKRNKFGVPGEVTSIEYDPNRSSRIALIKYKDGDWRYILAPLGLNVGDSINSGENASISVGNSLPLKSIPTGTQVHNIESVSYTHLTLPTTPYV